MNATTQIIAKIEAELAAFDVRLLESTKEYFKGLVATLKQAKIDNDHQRDNCWVYYPALFAACGGKGNYQLIQYGYSDRVEAIIINSEKTKAQKRNIKIAKKLVESEITEVLSVELVHSDDGFNGYFDVLTTKGNKRVYIDTIYAGGYNIQCAHLRVLVKVK